MIVPNVLNAASSSYAASWLSDAAVLDLSVTDFFRAWEPLPESGALTYPRFVDISGRQFCKDQLRPGSEGIQTLGFFRSSWAVLASAARRWSEMADAYGLPGDSSITLRSFKKSSSELQGEWRFEDGKSLPRHLGRAILDDRYGRQLEIAQNSRDGDLSVVAGWRVEDYKASLLQETRVTPHGRAKTTYCLNFDDLLLEGLWTAVDLPRSSDFERLAMRLAALIERSGLPIEGSAPFVLEKGKRQYGKDLVEETFRIHFARRPGSSVVLKKMALSSKGRQNPYHQGLEIRIQPDALSASSSLPLALLEKLWNPVYLRALQTAFGEPALA